MTWTDHTQSKGTTNTPHSQLLLRKWAPELLDLPILTENRNLDFDIKHLHF